MTDFFENSFESIKNLKQELEEEDKELKAMLNKKHLGGFELDRLMNSW